MERSGEEWGGLEWSGSKHRTQTSPLPEVADIKNIPAKDIFAQLIVPGRIADIAEGSVAGGL